MITPNPFLRIESPYPSNERLRSAFLNCICPECGGVSAPVQKSP